MAHEQLLKKAAELLLSVEKSNNPFIVRARYETCKRCRRFDAERKRCTVCGCCMETKVRLMTNKNPKRFARVEITHCPLGLWGDRVIADLYRRIDGLEPLDAAKKREESQPVAS